MDLTTLVEEMKVEARTKPARIETPADMVLKIQQSIVRRVTEIDGQKCQIQLNLSLMPKAGPHWHLSFSHLKHEPMPDLFVDKIKAAFLGNHDYFRIPSVWGEAVHQYIAKAPEEG